ncbi:MAG: hypothetical protein ABMA00_18945 [Gemmatimonas sp.]
MLPSVAVSVCPDSAELTITILGLAVLMALVAGMVGHGVLRPLLEARGIAPWRLRDSLGSMPLVLLGSALVGGTAAAFAVWGVTGCDVAGWVVMITSAKMIAGVVMMRLGLLALRKLV